MAVPKQKKSRANTRTRRSAWKAAPIRLQNIKGSNGEALVAPRRLAKAAKLGLYQAEDTFE